MAFRRPFRRSSRSFPRRRSFGPRLRPPSGPRRWQAAHFFFDGVDLIESGIFLTESVELLKIQDHIGGAAGTAIGSTLSNISRRVELGGIVFNYGHSLIGPADETQNPSDIWLHGLYLVTDRLDSDGQPTSLPNWQQTMSPISTIGSSVTEDDEYPLRVHWRDMHLATSFAGLVSTPTTNANLLAPHPTRTVNLRLRRFLDDFHGLYFQFFDLYSSDPEATLSIHKWVGGTLYYRWRF